MGLGLQWAGANDAMAEQIRQQIKDRLQAEATQRGVAQQQFENDYKNRALAQQDELKNAQISAMAGERQDAQRERGIVQGRLINEAIPAGDLQPENDPAIALTRPAGGQWTPQQSLPSTQTQGDISGGNATTTPQAPTPTGMFIHGATSQQAEKAISDKRAADEETRKNAADANNVDLKNWMASLAERKLDDAAPKEQPDHIYPMFQNGVPVGLQRVVNGVATPVQGAAPTKAAPVNAAEAKDSLNKKNALGTIDQLDSAIDDAKDLIGPGAGRVSNVQQMIGNPDPKIQALGMFIKGAKARTDLALTNSARSAASPGLMKQWDALLGNNLDYNAMKSSVNAMRQMIQGPAATISVTAPDGSVHPFATQAQADQFKKLAGIP